MKLKGWLDANRGVFYPRDLRFLLNVVLGPAALGDAAGVVLNPARRQFLDTVKKAYAQGAPLAYILGKEEFYGGEFTVTPRVLIPRPETELIVEKSIEIIKNHRRRMRVLDLCCGSGNIAVTIKKEVGAKGEVFASDVSGPALEVAKLNASFHKVDVKFLKTDLFAGWARRRFDLIVSNPPYVETRNVKGSLTYEPRIALAAGRDGLYFIKKILRQAHRYLNVRGYLIIEMGYNHCAAVTNFIRNLGKYEIIEWIKDYSGYWRGSVIRYG